MSRKPTSVNKEALNLLRHMIKRKCNLNCNSYSEIQALHDGIAKSTKVLLSVQTLSRFFGVIRSDFNPSHYTLDTLSRYLNYSSFRHFQLLNEAAIVEDDQAVFISEIFNSMFSGVENSNSVGSFHTMHRNLQYWLVKNPQYYPDVYSVVAKSRVGRQLYFEDQVNIDGLNEGFGNSLHYYLLHAGSGEERMYVYSLFCYWYYLNNDVEKFREYFELMSQFSNSEMMCFHPNVLDRFYAAFILNESIASHPHDFPANISLPDFDLLTSSSLPSNSSVQHVTEAFILTGEFQKAWETINNFAIIGQDNDMKSDRIAEMNVLKLFAGYMSGHYSKRRILSLYLEQINKKLPQTSENYCTFFLIMLKYKLFSRDTLRLQALRSFDALVKKTGFKYFSVLFDRYVREE